MILGPFRIISLRSAKRWLIAALVCVALAAAVAAHPDNEKARNRAEKALRAGDFERAEKLYREKHRPLFHFTSRRGWLNDPNGLVFYKGE